MEEYIIPTQTRSTMSTGSTETTTHTTTTSTRPGKQHYNTNWLAHFRRWLILGLINWLIKYY